MISFVRSLLPEQRDYSKPFISTPCFQKQTARERSAIGRHSLKPPYRKRLDQPCRSRTITASSVYHFLYATGRFY